MTRFAVALMCLSFACATPSTPPEYHRGAYAPAPAPVRAGVGAPVVGQPGQDPAQYPRSPYGRVLPEDEKTRREPGVWATETPKASADDDSRPKINPDDLYDFFPKDAEMYEAVIGSECLRLMDKVFKARNITAPGTIEEFKSGRYPIYHWRCIVAGLYQRCVELRHAENQELRKEGNGYPSLERLDKQATWLQEKECAKGISQKGTDTLNIFKRQLENRFRLGERGR